MNIILSLYKRSKSSRTRFAFKVGLAAGTVYYISEQGVWKDSRETTKLYGKLSENISPYIKQAKGQIPIEIPSLPSTNKISFLAKQYWNKGVSATFTFLGDLPDHVSSWTHKGIDAAMGNQEVKNFVQSFSGTPESIETTKK